MTQLTLMNAEERGHVLKNRFLTQIETDHRRNVGIDGFIVGDSGADCVSEGDIAGTKRVQQTGATEQAVVLESKWIDKVVVNAPVDHVNRFQSFGGPRVHTVVMDH